jgi:hypothetical protein
VQIQEGNAFVDATILQKRSDKLVFEIPLQLTTGSKMFFLDPDDACCTRDIEYEAFVVTKAPCTPVVTCASPSQGPIGTLVTLTGKHLTEIQCVQFQQQGRTCLVPAHIVGHPTSCELQFYVPSGLALGASVYILQSKCPDLPLRKIAFSVTRPEPKVNHTPPLTGSPGRLTVATGSTLYDVSSVRLLRQDGFPLPCLPFLASEDGTQLSLAVPLTAVPGMLYLVLFENDLGMPSASAPINIVAARC